MLLRAPPVMGAIIHPNPHASGRRENPLARFESSVIRPKMLFSTPVFPLSRPVEIKFNII